jgi:hypothetical protein
MAMGQISGILLLVSFCIMVYYLFKGGSIFVALGVTGLFWSVVAGMSFNSILKDALQGVVDTIAPTVMVMILGSWFGQVLVQTRIVATIIRKVVELGGDRPLVVAILVSLTTGFLFTGMWGVGSAIAVGVIAIPILMSLGLPASLATASFTTGIGAAMTVNIVDVTIFVNIITAAGVPKGSFPTDNWLRYGWIFFGLYLLADVAMLTYYLTVKGVNRAWAAKVADVLPVEQAPWYSLICPLIPMILIMVFHWLVVPTFLLSILLTLLLTGRMKPGSGGIDFLQKTFHDGHSDISGVALAWISIQVFTMAAAKAQPMLQPILALVVPQTALGIALFYGILAPLALYRGPTMTGGAGAALFGFLVATGKLPVALIFAVAKIVNAYGNAVCPTQSWTIWIINYAKVPQLDHIKCSWIFNWIAAFLGCMIAYYMYRM